METETMEETEADAVPTKALEIPSRMLEVVGVAAKENTRYQVDGVYVETRDTGIIAVAATDGRRLLVAEWNQGLFDDQFSVIVPGAVARSAAKLARGRYGDSEPMAKVQSCGSECTLVIFGTDGEVVFNWQVAEHAFPPYRDIIPDWSDSTGVSLIAVTPELVAGTLKTMQRVVGVDPKVRIYLPSKIDRPIGFESQDGDGVNVLAVVMPCAIEEWTEQAIKGDAKPETALPPQAAAQAERQAESDVAITKLANKGSDPDIVPINEAIKAGKKRGEEITTPGAGGWLPRAR